MSGYSIPYGKTQLAFTIPDVWQVDLIAPPETPAAPHPQGAVERALENPVGGVRLEDFRGARSAAIAINDKTRPVPHAHLLPPLLKRLEEIGLPAESIQLIIASGMHPPMRREEFPQVVPDAILRRYPVVCHAARDESNLVWLGDTPLGTPIWINRRYMEADLRLVIGNIEPHQFQGFSGGVKSAAIGLAGAETINQNHSRMTDPRSRLGRYEDNPARQDVEAIGARIGVHFALNAILNQEKAIVQALAGEPRQVMESGIPLARQVCQVAAPAAYDFLIVSPGGHPKDINLYQAQKALYHACLVARPGARLILAAACPEGAGSQSYTDWMQGMHSFAEVFERFEREGFRVGPHKAFQIARDASHVRLAFLSEMQPDFARSLLLEPVVDLQSAIDEALESLPSTARLGIMPHATSTIPYLA
jgi:nickel-dependent lactate racemase